MNGYCIMITDEGASFLGDLKRYETKHESYISLLNQLFDGKGDKMTLAKNVERPVLRNSTSISIGVQQKSYCDAIHGLTETLWPKSHQSQITAILFQDLNTLPKRNTQVRLRLKSNNMNCQLLSHIATGGDVTEADQLTGRKRTKQTTDL